MSEKLVSVTASSPFWSDRIKRLAFIIVLVIAGIILFEVADAIRQIIIAVVISFLLNPITTFLEKRVLRFLPGARNWAILFTFILLVLLFIVLILIVIPAIFSQLSDFASTLPEQLESLETRSNAFLSQPLIFNGQPVLIGGQPLVPLEQLTAAFGENPTDVVTGNAEQFDLLGTVRGIFASVSAPTFRFIGGAFSALLSGILLLTMIFYLLKDGAKFVGSIIDFAPPAYRTDARRLFYELGQVWNAYLRGQLILSSFIGIVVFLTATVLGIPNAPVLGLISFTLEFIPTIGPLVALVPAVLLALLSESTTIPGLSGLTFGLVVIVVWTVIQNVQAILITPRVMGDSLDLHPIVVIIGVLSGASLAGALGVILAAPTIASLRLFGGYVYQKIFDQPPFPDVTVSPPAAPSFLARMFGARNAAPMVQSAPITQKPNTPLTEESTDDTTHR